MGVDRGLVVFVLVAALSVGAVWGLLSRPPRAPSLPDPLNSSAPASVTSTSFPSPPTSPLSPASQTLPSSDADTSISPDIIAAPETNLLLSLGRQKPPAIPEQYPAGHLSGQEGGSRTGRPFLTEKTPGDGREKRTLPPDDSSSPASGRERLEASEGRKTGGEILSHYRIQDGDTLPELARRFYGDPGKWRVIFEANRSRIPDPDLLPIGTEIILPALQSQGTD
ncbi:MAG: LysM peptidoglycan-binding domain-containing protein [Thermogutta sp.]|uniref:LysM peptidoglycan-binding domain-containing protein n=1 Tax=Thermogutta sp. TaxID=1962930 RepID=UPI0019847D5F|nr:LysM peptidoglycan-binding domain-containing protein [Thermogutta sp.]MBC7353770.1 LysM peptidoglycan-binding domain-containing protein [Thermogutta sp.]